MKVTLVAKTEGVGKYKNLSTEDIISSIARHGKIKNDEGKLIRYLLSNKHMSPLDMINFTFEIETSRAIGRQILRHSSIKFQEHSQRYSDRVEFENIELRKEHPTNRQSSTEVFDPILTLSLGGEYYASKLIDNIQASTNALYKLLIEAGVAKECARMILPECTKTTISANGTLRSWLSFLNVRLDGHAQKEIVIIAQHIGEILSNELPNVFNNINWKQGMFM